MSSFFVIWGLRMELTSDDHRGAEYPVILHAACVRTGTYDIQVMKPSQSDEGRRMQAIGPHQYMLQSPFEQMHCSIISLSAAGYAGAGTIEADVTCVAGHLPQGNMFI